MLWLYLEFEVDGSSESMVRQSRWFVRVDGSSRIVRSYGRTDKG